MRAACLIRFSTVQENVEMEAFVIATINKAFEMEKTGLKVNY